MEHYKKFQPIQIAVRHTMIAEAVKWVINRLAFTFDRQNMNRRSLSEKLDDGIMGEIASVALMQFLSDNGRHTISYDQVRKDEYRDPDPGWDILTSREKSFVDWIKNTEDVKTKPPFAYSFSIKSSRIPKADNDNINISVERRDFKILKRSISIDLDITADFEVQVYYPLAKSVYNSELKISWDDISNNEIEGIIKKMQLVERYSDCFLSGAVSKEALIQYSNSLPEHERFWSSNHAGHEKRMWKAPLWLGISLQNIS